MRATRRRRFLADARLLDGLDLNYATRLATGACTNIGLKWIEEALPPDDYWGYRDLQARRAARHAGHHRRA